MQLFQQLQQEGISPNKFTFLQVIKACASLRALGNGRHVHNSLSKVVGNLMSFWGVA